MNTQDRIPLPRLAGELKALTGQPAPRYRVLADAARDGQFQTEMDGRYHYVKRADLPSIALALHLVPAPEQAAAA